MKLTKQLKNIKSLLLKPHYVAISGFAILFLGVIVWYFFFSGRKEGFYKDYTKNSSRNKCPPCDMLTAYRNFLLKSDKDLLKSADLTVRYYVTKIKFRNEVAGYPPINDNQDVAGCVEYELTQCDKEDNALDCKNIFKCNPYDSGDEKDNVTDKLKTYIKKMKPILEESKKIEKSKKESKEIESKYTKLKLDKKLRDMYQTYIDLSIEKETGETIH
jgi:hypothetical protein